MDMAGISSWVAEVLRISVGGDDPKPQESQLFKKNQQEELADYCAKSWLQSSGYWFIRAHIGIIRISLTKPGHRTSSRAEGSDHAVKQIYYHVHRRSIHYIIIL
jgi:hypothetical protein